jgi:cobaltochelatase CobN
MFEHMDLSACAKEDIFIYPDSPAKAAISFYKRLGVPVLKPILGSRQTNKEWEKNQAGIAAELSWSVIMPEFDGMLEPFYIAGTDSSKGILGSR